MLNHYELGYISSNISTPTKLKDTNFLIWRQQVLATVRDYDLEGNLTGFAQLPQMWIE